MQENPQQPVQPQSPPPQQNQPQGYAPQPNLPPVQQTPPAVPVQQGDYLHPITDGPKKTYHPKRMIIVLSVAVGLSLLIVALLVLYAIRPAKITAHQEETTQSDQQSNVAVLTASDTLKLVQKHLSDPVTAKRAITLPVIAPKKKFYTVIPEDTPVEGTSAPVRPGDVTKVSAAILKEFETKKFTKIERQGMDSVTGYFAYFTRDDVLCQMSIAPAVTEAEPQVLEVDCTDIAHYSEYADAQQPLVSLYTPAATASTYLGFTGKPNVKPSQTADYSLVEIPVSTVIDQKLTSTGTVALFYQSPDKLWHYFIDRDTGVLVDCSKYRTPELLSAYAGTTCSVSNSSKTNVVTAPKTRR